jgi:hypothetical protein
MEEFHASAGTHVGPEDRAAAGSVLDAGRLGGVLCGLQRARFDGVLNILNGERSATIGFRDGTPVTFDDATPGHTLADQFVERGQLTRAQCNTVLARMTETLVDDEAVGFCEHAVQLGYLTEDEAKVELSMRIRARMMQLLGLRDCETSLTPGLAALLDRREFPQHLGAILYMGVRTFYEEDFLSSCQPDLSQTYVQLTTAPATIVQYFGLDDEEYQLLRRIQPDDPASQLVETRKVERVHLLALLLLMRLAQFCEVFSQPQPRATSPRLPSPRAHREREHVELPREDKSVARRAPTPPEAMTDQQPPPLAARTAQAVHAPPQAVLAPPQPVKTQQAPRPSQAAKALLHDPPAPGPTARPMVDATQEALLEAAARTARMRRSLPARRTSKQADPMPTSAAEGGSVAARVPDGNFNAATKSAQPAEARPEYAKAHLQELIARRKHTASASESNVPVSARDPVRELREARSLLHAQQFARAEKVLLGLVELDSTSVLYKVYHLWARWRAQPEGAESVVSELQDLAKKLVADAEHGGFAAYVLGHVFLHDKRDDLAEKFFKRAYAADRTNKDAERHLLILERRKQTAADGGSGANRKLFGIQLPNSKPKP